MVKRRRHSVEFKRQAVERMKGCENIRNLAQELDVQPKLLYIWKNLAEGPSPRGLASPAESREQRQENKLKEENRKLKEALGEKALEIDFFKGALRRIKEARQNNTESGGTVSTPKSERGTTSGKAN
jgi:transposase-like protein